MPTEGDDTSPSSVVAVDKGKSTQHAVKWALDHLLVNNPTIVLVHVKPPGSNPQGIGGTDHGGRDQLESEVAQMFRSYRLLSARKGVKVREVILEDADITSALVNYININRITNIVVGTSNKNSITRKFRNTDIPTALSKSAPDFCAVFVIYKGRTITVRSAKAPLPHMGGPPRQLLIPQSPLHHFPTDSEDHLRGARRSSTPPSTVLDERSFERSSGNMKMPPRDSSLRQPRSSHSRDSISDDLDFHGEIGFQSSDFGESFECSTLLNEAPESPNLNTQRDLEAEMKRLKLELKQTMDMYSNACREAITAKQKAEELQKWKLEEARKCEEAQLAEAAALALVEKEKVRCKAAIEAAKAAQRIAEQEVKKRLNAEMAMKREAEEKKRALDALAQNDVRYRKYTIEEIEVATDKFSKDKKIGEGGYGPVYRGTLDHTPVAIKVLRPDAAQGRKQFQQEVEVLCRIRHPNMVLLLGACPEYGCLVYEYMENGSLDDCIFNRRTAPPLPWSIRFKVAAEIATGLLFLHQAKPEPLVHRDLKPANILLDRNYISKISDVGLARLVPPSVADTVTQYKMTSAAGTFCYIDPEYQKTGMLGVKSDIYSLGIMLLQIITAKPPMGLTHHVERAIEQGVFVEMLDPTVTDWPVEEALSFAKLALNCSELRRKDRPDLSLVILPELNRLRNFGEEWETSSSSSGGYGFGTRSYDSAPPTSWSHMNQEKTRGDVAWRSDN